MSDGNCENEVAIMPSAIGEEAYYKPCGFLDPVYGDPTLCSECKMRPLREENVELRARLAAVDELVEAVRKMKNSKSAHPGLNYVVACQDAIFAMEKLEAVRKGEEG